MTGEDARLAAAVPAPEPARSRASASDQVFFGIIRGLEDRRFVPGQRLVESELAARFGVGRNSVREALQRLRAEGLVDLSPHRGASIRTLSWQEALDLLDIMERMLGLLGRVAVRGSGHPAQARALRAALEALEAASRGRDDGAFSEARRQFYRALLAMGNNPDLRRMFTTIHIPVLYARQRIPSLHQIRLADYRRLADAVLAGDAQAADQAGRAHVCNVREALLAQVGGERSSRASEIETEAAMTGCQYEPFI